MPAIPLPFVVALLLMLLFARLWMQKGTIWRPSALFVAACMLLVIIVGLRWSLNIPVLRFLQPIAASALPPVAWLVFAQLKRKRRFVDVLLHFLPVVLIAILSALWPIIETPVDLLLAGQFFGYGTALLSLGREGPDGLRASRLSDAPRAHKATVFVGAALIFSGLTDLVITVDFGFFAGAHIPAIISFANLISLPLLAYAVVVVNDSLDTDTENAAEEDEAERPERSDVEAASDLEIFTAFDDVMKKKRLFLDPDLTLNRIARRAGIPARQISAAINRVRDRNVSQVVNEYRVREAQRLLKETDQPVTMVMFESGFQTKSNFNKEFRRVTGVSPSEYRRRPGSGEID